MDIHPANLSGACGNHQWIERHTEISFHNQAIREQRQRILQRGVDKSRLSGGFHVGHIEGVTKYHHVSGLATTDGDAAEAIPQSRKIAGGQIECFRSQSRIDGASATGLSGRTQSIAPDVGGCFQIQRSRRSDRGGTAKEVSFIGRNPNIAGPRAQSPLNSQGVLVAIFGLCGQCDAQQSGRSNRIGVELSIKHLFGPVGGNGGNPCNAREHGGQTSVQIHEVHRIRDVCQQQITIITDKQINGGCRLDDGCELIEGHIQSPGCREQLSGLDYPHASRELCVSGKSNGAIRNNKLNGVGGQRNSHCEALVIAEHTQVDLNRVNHTGDSQRVAHVQFQSRHQHVDRDFSMLRHNTQFQFRGIDRLPGARPPQLQTPGGIHQIQPLDTGPDKPQLIVAEFP